MLHGISTVSLVLWLLAAALLPTVGHCVPACPGSAETGQPNGARINVVLRGDEHFHWNEDTAGYLITQSPRDQGVGLRQSRTTV